MLQVCYRYATGMLQVCWCSKEGTANKEVSRGATKESSPCIHRPHSFLLQIITVIAGLEPLYKPGLRMAISI
jgi:hypothetical protein